MPIPSHPTRRSVLQTLAAALTASAAPAGRKPNVVVILADDLGYQDTGAYGSTDVPTPHIDSIAKNGVKFTDGYVSAPVCSPSRAALLTGRYQQRFGHEFNTGPMRRDIEQKLGLPHTETTLPQVLKAAGYRTGMVGKWHLGMNPGFHPMDRGFEEYFGFLFGAHTYVDPKNPNATSVDTGEGGLSAQRPAVSLILRGREPVDEPAYLTEAFTREAIAYIDRHQKDPFFLYLAFNAVHTPLQAMNKYVDRFAHIEDERHRVLAAMTSAMDDGIGAVLSKLKSSGIDKDTLVIFLSDNGCPIYTKAGTNGPLLGSKLTLFEGGVRVPFLMQFPGRIRAGSVYRNPIVSRDLFPTIAALGGAEGPAGVKLDGVDLMPFLSGKQKGVPHDVLFWRNGPNSAMRKGKWKMIVPGQGTLRLYDLSKDLGEQHNLAETFPDVVQGLKAEFAKWESQLMKPRWAPVQTVKLPYGGEEIGWTV